MPEIKNSQQKQSVSLNNKNIVNKTTINTGAIRKIQKEQNLSSPTVSTGILRYLTINKRNLSPQKTQSLMKKQKVVENPLDNNRFAVLSDDGKRNDIVIETPKKLRPPPIFLREKNSSFLVKTLIETIGRNSFHVVPLKKGAIEETKIVIYKEDDYRKVSKYLNISKKNFYTYQLKSSKGLVIVIKGIESSVKPTEIKEALEDLGYKPKQIMNIFNREKVPQPLFKVELEPNDKKLKSNETHPIYSVRYLLNRRVTIEEPYKRNNPVQCTNCQEYGHTRNYCTLRTVCVVCGDLHSSTECSVVKNGLGKKCGNCGGDHSANYRGCPVYKELLKRLREKKGQLQGGTFKPQFVFSEHAFKPITAGVTSIKEVLSLPKQNFNTQNSTKEVSYANILKSGQQQPSVSQNAVGLESLLQTLTQNITTLSQNICTFMSTMQSNIQELLKAQNQMLQIILTKK